METVSSSKTLILIWGITNDENDLLLTMGRSRRGDQHYGREERLERYSQMAKWLPLYDEDDWFDKAIEQEVLGLEDSQDGILAKFTIFKDQYWWKEDVNKEDTHWFKFQEAVKEHQALALGPVNKRCKNGHRHSSALTSYKR